MSYGFMPEGLCWPFFIYQYYILSSLFTITVCCPRQLLRCCMFDQIDTKISLERICFLCLAFTSALKGNNSMGVLSMTMTRVN